MFLSLDWLKDFIDIPKNITPAQLGEKLTMHTVEIDDVVDQAKNLDKVVVGEIQEVKPHPNADKLRLAKVDTGVDLLDIVCGAPNIKAGQKVPVALVGAALPNGLAIKESKIRGEKSQGMLCAEDELGLGDDHEGILILDAKAKIGTPLAQVLGMDDVLFEVDNKSITNRPDLWGHYGYARELRAFLESKTTKQFERLSRLDIEVDKEKDELKVKVEDHKQCPRYVGVKMSGITVADSPDWLKKRLIAVGVRPINNIVDVTNYVMYELGQPMHAFDAAKVDEIIVRQARKGECIVTLDNEERKLTAEDIVIADSRQPIGIAGVMGGANSEISAASTGIILEAANFNFLSVRKTATRLGLRSEASQRFEKNLDPNLGAMAMARAVELVKKACPAAQVCAPVADQQQFELDQGPIIVELAWLEKFIGEKIDGNRVEKMLVDLGFTVKVDAKIMEVTVPTWRATKDISQKEDIAEEIARVYGYDNIARVVPKAEITPPPANELRELERKIKAILTGAPAMNEVYNYSFVGEEQLRKLGIDASTYIKLQNPIVAHQTLLRQNLAPNMIEAIKANQARFNVIRLFEIGSVYLGIEGYDLIRPDSRSKLPLQEKRLCLAIAGENPADSMDELKGVISYLFSNFKINVRFQENEMKPNWADERCSTQILVEEQRTGFLNQVSLKTSQKVQLKKTSAIAEMNLDVILAINNRQGVVKFKEFEKFPPSRRDIALVVDEKVAYNDLYDAILDFNHLIAAAELFDIYHGDQVGKGKKSLAFHITYQADRTLKSEEVDIIQKQLVKELERKFEAKIRE